jgi:hypothetical protein
LAVLDRHATVSHVSATAEAIDLFAAPEGAERALAEKSRALADADEPPAEVLAFAEGLCAQLIDLQRGDWPQADPYLLAELMQTVAAIERTLRNEDPERQAEELEIELEALRDIVSDLREAVPVRDDRPAIDIARWLKATTQASYQELAVFGPSKRTWERWLSPHGESQPHGDDEARIRLAAAIVNQLRHAMTPRGALRWFSLEHPELAGRPPAALLADLANARKLVALAGEVRRSDLG